MTRKRANGEGSLYKTKDGRDGHGHALVVRNGYATEREVLLGAGLQAGRLSDIFKLMEAAEQRCWKLTGAHLVAMVRAGARFEIGELVEGSEEKHAA